MLCTYQFAKQRKWPIIGLELLNGEGNHRCAAWSSFSAGHAVPSAYLTMGLPWHAPLVRALHLASVARAAIAVKHAPILLSGQVRGHFYFRHPPGRGHWCEPEDIQGVVTPWRCGLGTPVLEAHAT